MNPERLQKVLASAGIASRRDSEDVIASGRVAVNGKVVRVPGTRVDPETDTITIDGQPLGPIQPRTYFMLNKPAGVVSTTDDPQNRQTVVELVQSEARLFPVGRLDYDSEGLIILTDDGALTQQLTHPSNQVEKEYRVLLNETPSSDALRDWRNGLLLDGVMTSPAWVEVLERGDDGSWVRVVLREGRKRQIREVAKLLGYDVLRLIRVREGPLQLGDLPTGESRPLTEAEVEQLWEHAEKTARETQAAMRERPSGPRRAEAAGREQSRQTNPSRQQDERRPARGRDSWRDERRPARDQGSWQDERRPVRPVDDYETDDNWGNRRDYQPRDNRGASPRDYGRREERGSGPRDFQRRDERGSPRDYGQREERGSGPRDFQRGSPRDYGRREERGSGPRDFQRRDERGSPRDYGQREERGSGPRDFQRGSPRDYGRREERGSGPRDFQRRDERGSGPRDFQRRDERGSPRDYGRREERGSGPRDFQRRDDRGGSRDYRQREERGASPRDYGRREERGSGPRDFQRRDDRSGSRDYRQREERGASPRDYGRREERGGGPRDFQRRDDRGGSRDYGQREDRGGYSSGRAERPRQDTRPERGDFQSREQRPDAEQEARPRSPRPSPRLNMRIRRPRPAEDGEE